MRSRSIHVTPAAASLSMCLLGLYSSVSFLCENWQRSILLEPHLQMLQVQTIATCCKSQ